MDCQHEESSDVIRPLFFLAVAAAAPLAAQPSDPYAPGKQIVADLQHIVTPNGLQETFTATLGGVPQVVNVRGADRHNPILIYVQGGLGAVEMPFAWAFQRPWEDYFTVVQYDQRAAGRSYRLADPKAVAPAMTIDRYRQDAIELIELLRKRYGQRKVFLLVHSWGSVVGLSVAATRPDLLCAYIGMGQYIDPQRGEEASYRWTLDQARKDGNAKAIAELERLMPYPATSRSPASMPNANGQSTMGLYFTGTLMVTSIFISRAFRLITPPKIGRRGAMAAPSR